MNKYLAFSIGIVAFSIVWAFVCSHAYRHVSKRVAMLLVCLGVIYNNMECEDYVLVLYPDHQCAAYVGELDYDE